ncbi:hypothetical protein B0H10DRAFT_1868073 [Mycena sp. CBHHK59/15]|nr:hypothetical protein B0H10DRAFT_1868073 [Mycena sp. CBHHK59/15]
MAEELKAAGNALFASKDYAGAARKYSEAIKLNDKNIVLYCNRAACYLELKRYQDGLSDATNATEIDLKYSKAWYRKGACEDALGCYPESIESHQMAMDTCVPKSPQYVQCQTALNSVQAKIMNPSTMSIDVMRALARAHDIPLPYFSSNRDAIFRALTSHPLFGTEPKLRLLLIPLSEAEPLTQHELVRGPNIEWQIAALLGCSLTDSVVLHSEDQVAYANDRPAGVGVGRLHTSYEAYMDDNALSAQPLNRRASRLLHRPNTHGPILVMKTTFIKSTSSPFGRSEDILAWERVDEAELLSDRFRALRAECEYWRGR